MSNVTWQQLTSSLNMAELGASASECHGIICGLICGGINVENGSWLGAFNDLMNDGIALPVYLMKDLAQVFSNSCNEFSDDDYQLKLLLIDDEQPLSDRAVSLAQWSESFMAGFAIGNESGQAISKEVKETLADLSQISQIDTQITDDEESQQSFEEIIEYVRMSALFCFAEMGKKIEPEKKDSKLH